MKLSSRCEYALLALVYLARHYEKGFISARKIAAEKAIPLTFLEQILLTLKSAKFLRSVKGKGGGFSLAKNPSDISLAEIIRLIDGALAPSESVSKYFYEPTPIKKEKQLLAVFKEIRDNIADKLESTSLADIVK